MNPAGDVSRETSRDGWLESQLLTLRLGAERLGLTLSPEQLDKFARYLELLRQENQRTNLFSRHDAARLAERHLLESIAWVPAVRPPLRAPLLDLGSGAGFPGIPLAILLPDLQMVLVESRKKKALFLERVVRELRLPVQVFAGRVEEFARQTEHQEAYPEITARAVAPLARLAKWCAPLQPLGGRLFTFKGDRLKEELEDLHPLQNKGLKFAVQVIDYAVWHFSAGRPERVQRKLVCLEWLEKGEYGDGKRSF